MHRIVDDEAVELLDGPFAGIVYRYGWVKFEPDYVQDHLKVSFIYEIISDFKPSDEKTFRDHIGGVLVELIREGIETGNLVFLSGTPATISDSENVDAHRNENSVLSDIL